MSVMLYAGEFTRLLMTVRVFMLRHGCASMPVVPFASKVLVLIDLVPGVLYHLDAGWPVLAITCRGPGVLVESPTGSGKTVTLLCSALVAQHHLAETRLRTPRVVFCTRAHRQFKQFVHEEQKLLRRWLDCMPPCE